MAELDPCEINLDEEEEQEEVDPEFEDTSAGVVPGGSTSASDPITSGTAEETISETASETIETMEQLFADDDLREVLMREAAEATRNQLNADLGEVLENDVSLTPVYQNSLSAGKSTWIIGNSALLDFGLTQDDKFRSKPEHLMAFLFKLIPFKAPSNVIDSNYKIDPIRFLGDKMWFNASHVDGPVEFNTRFDIRVGHNKSAKAPDFYFINKRGLGNQIELYFDPGKAAYIRPATTTSLSSQWLNLSSLKRAIRSFNYMNFKTKYELFEIYALKRSWNREDWSWQRYFYGYVDRPTMDTITPSIGSESQITETFREAANSQQQHVGWKDIYIKYGVSTNNTSLNSFPVIPFYGPKFAMNQVTDPSRMQNPPTVGEIMFEDYTTNVNDLLSKEEADIVDVGNKSYFDIRTVYSYYDCLYERVFSPVLEELELPSPYVSEGKLSYETSSRRSEGISAISPQDFEELMFTRLERVDILTGRNIFNSRDLNQQSPITSPSEQTELVEDLIQVGDRESRRKIAIQMQEYYGFNIGNTNKDLYLSSMTPEQLDAIYDQRYMNSMFVEMELGKIEKSQLAESLTFNGDDHLVKSLFGSLTSMSDTETLSSYDIFAGVKPEKGRINASYVDQLLQSGLNQGEDTLSTTFEYSDTIPIENTRTIDFSDWFKQTFDRLTSDDAASSPIEKFANIFRLLTVKARVARFVNSRARSYRQILTGTPAKSEVLGFTIEKYAIDFRGDKSYVNSFHILSNNDRDVERFIDSQVKYGKVYEYKINRIVAIVGNRYAYVIPGPEQQSKDEGKDKYDSTNKNKPNKDFTQKFAVANVPFLKVMSIPSTSKRVAVSDRPPIYPNADFVPFKNVKNKVLINLSSNTGEFLSPPTILEADDNIQFYQVAASQGLPGVQDLTLEDASALNFSLNDSLSESEMIRFRSDDPATTFEIFRLEEYPKSYQDFVGNKILKKRTKADNYAFLDNIEPNKKYYYIFRVEDVHGHVSNPTHIYEIQLISLNEAVRLSVKVVEPEDLATKKKNLKQSTDDLRIFLSIKPNVNQRILNIPESGNFTDLAAAEDQNSVFGQQEFDKLWGKKFKLRIKSKNTGKEIDIDFKFKAKVKLNEENKKVNLIC